MNAMQISAEIFFRTDFGDDIDCLRQEFRANIPSTAFQIASLPALNRYSL